MKFLYYLLEIPLTLAAVWLVVNSNAEGDVFNFELWPLESVISVNTKLTMCLLLLFGFIWGKINSWFAYSPLRQALRSQKKENKALNKEQEKLAETVSGLQKNIVGLQEKAKQQELEYAKNNPQPVTEQKLSNFFKKIKSFFTRKKEN